MKRDEAIKILRDMGTPEYRGSTERILAARKLGIEALEYFDKLCQSLPAFRDVKLPSETEE